MPGEGPKTDWETCSKGGEGFQKCRQGCSLSQANVHLCGVFLEAAPEAEEYTHACLLHVVSRAYCVERTPYVPRSLHVFFRSGCVDVVAGG